VSKFGKERDALERDRLQLRADNDSLQQQLGDCKREAEHKHIQDTMALKAKFEQNYEQMARRCKLKTM
jgi:hypothetical protein